MAGKVSQRVSTNKYYQAYQNYVAAHTQFDMTLYDRYMKLNNGNLGIVKNISETSKSMSKTAVQNYLGATAKIDNLTKYILKRFEEEDWESIHTKKEVTKNFSSLDRLLAHFQKIVFDLEVLIRKINKVGGSDRGLRDSVDKLKARLEQVRTVQQSDPSKDFVAFYGESGSSKITVAQASDFNKKGKLIAREGQHSVIDIGSLATFLRSNIQKLYKLFLEEVAVAEFGNGAVTGGKVVFGEALETAFADYSSSHLKSIRSGIGANEIGVDIKWMRAGGKGPSSYYANFGSPVGDFTILYNPAQKQTLLDADENISGAVGLREAARISQKSYSGLQGGKAGWIKGVDRVLGAYILNSGQGDPNLTWGLFRSFAFPASWGNAGNDFWDGLAKDAFLRQYAFDAVFGSGQDFITDFLINDTFYSGQYVAEKLFEPLRSNSKAQIFRGVFNSKPSIEDGEGTLANTIRHRWITPTEATAILRAKFIIEWKISQDTFVVA